MFNIHDRIKKNLFLSNSKLYPNKLSNLKNNSYCYNKYGKPIKCKYCLSNKIITVQKSKDLLDIKFVCEDCGMFIGFFACNVDQGGVKTYQYSYGLTKNFFTPLIIDIVTLEEIYNL